MSNCSFGLLEFATPEFYETLTDTNFKDADHNGYAAKNLIGDFDLESNGLSSSIINTVTEDRNDRFYDIDYTVGSDGTYYLNYTTDDLSSGIYLNGLGTQGSGYTFMRMFIDINEDQVVSVPDILDQEIDTQFSYKNSMNSGDLYQDVITSDMADVKTENGKLYVTLSSDVAAYIASNGYDTATLCYGNGEPVEVSGDGVVTLVYSNYAELFSGTYLKMVYSKTNASGSVQTGSAIIGNFLLNCMAEEVILTDEATGVQIRTTNLVVSPDSKLIVEEITDDPDVSGVGDDYEYIESCLGSAYQNILRYRFYIQSGDKIIEKTSNEVEICFPLGNMDRENIRLMFIDRTETEVNYGWVTNDTIEGDYLVIRTSNYWKLSSAYALYDLKSMHNVPAGRICMSAVWVMHVIIFVFFIKTEPASEQQEQDTNEEFNVREQDAAADSREQGSDVI